MANPEIELQSISISTPPAPSASTSAATSQEDDSPAPSASTSAATPLDSCGFDVFINHRGPDVKNTFASHLYGRLLQRGLRAFLDRRELQEGQNLTLQIQRAIRTATVHVAIFSPTYAQSKWCLEELLQMWEMCKSGAIIIPVFYHVKPAQLRWTQCAGGVYSEDLRNLEEKKTYDTQTHQEKPRHDPDTIQKWRKVLSDVSEISGFELDANNTDEGEVLDKIVESVVKNVKKRNLDEAAKDSENTALLEQRQQNHGILDVLLLWCGKIHAYGQSISPLFKIILILKLLGIIISMELSIMRFFGDSGEGIRRKKLRLNLDLLQLKWFFNCIFGFSTLKNPCDAFIVQKLAIKHEIPINSYRIWTGKTRRKGFQKVALETKYQ